MSSCAACAVPAAPPSADRRRPHVQLHCCPAIAAPAHSSQHDGSERAEPRARRSLIAPPSTSSTCADRVVVRRVRRPGRTAERRPTSSSRSASLLLCLSPCQLTRAATTTASARRAASTSCLDSAPSTSSSEHRSRCLGRGVRRSGLSSPRVFAQSNLTGRSAFGRASAPVRQKCCRRAAREPIRFNRLVAISTSLRSAPLRSASLRFAPLRSASLCVARFAQNREQLSLLIAPRSLFSWLGLEVATRDALSHLQPQPGAPGSLGTGGW